MKCLRVFFVFDSFVKSFWSAELHGEAKLIVIETKYPSLGLPESIDEPRRSPRWARGLAHAGKAATLNVTPSSPIKTTFQIPKTHLPV